MKFANPVLQGETLVLDTLGQDARDLGSAHGFPSTGDSHVLSAAQLSVDLKSWAGETGLLCCLPGVW